MIASYFTSELMVTLFNRINENKDYVNGVKFDYNNHKLLVEYQPVQKQIALVDTKTKKEYKVCTIPVEDMEKDYISFILKTIIDKNF